MHTHTKSTCDNLAGKLDLMCSYVIACFKLGYIIIIIIIIKLLSGEGARAAKGKVLAYKQD